MNQPPNHSSSTQQAPQRETEFYGGVESDVDEDLGPPKKKRRRQALSCTECKRRKIKCDRNQPCAPCSRRGEQAKCQWHIVEPVEKYVTRAEYDELKAKFDELWNLVHRLLPSASTATSSSGVQYYNSMPPASIDSTQSYQTPVYPSPMAPPTSYPPHLESSSPSIHNVYRYNTRQEDSQSPRHHASGGGSGTSPVISTLQNAQAQSRMPMSTMSGGRLVSDHKSPGTSGSGGATSSAGTTTTGGNARRSPLSLTSVTGPPGGPASYEVAHSSHSSQSKNFHAQTLILGERLRLAITLYPLEGPVSPITPLTIRHRHRLPTTLLPHTLPLHRTPRRSIRHHYRICTWRVRAVRHTQADRLYRHRQERRPSRSLRRALVVDG